MLDMELLVFSVCQSSWPSMSFCLVTILSNNFSLKVQVNMTCKEKRKQHPSISAQLLTLHVAFRPAELHVAESIVCNPDLHFVANTILKDTLLLSLTRWHQAPNFEMIVFCSEFFLSPSWFPKTASVNAYLCCEERKKLIDPSAFMKHRYTRKDMYL